MPLLLFCFPFPFSSALKRRGGGGGYSEREREGRRGMRGKRPSFLMRLALASSPSSSHAAAALAARSRFFLPMEERNPIKTPPPRALACLLFLLFFHNFAIGSSQPLHSDPVFSQGPSTSPPSPAASPDPGPDPNTHRLRRILLGVLLGSLAGTSFSLLLILFVRLCLLYANRTPILKGPVVFSPTISPKALQFALSDDTRLVPLPGSSTRGGYFRTVLDDGLVVAVKRLEPVPPDAASPAPTQSNSAKRRVQRELEGMARVSHRNVMGLRAYVRGDGVRFWVVYDYVPGGSLEDVLKRVRAGQLRLGWEARHRIAIGVAKGLRHLHFECNPRILHYDLKPSNVMLDEEFEPKLGDCGLARLLGFNGGAGAQPASCYTAPECLQSCRYTDKSDIFSFGVMLGVLLTGRDPCDPFFDGEAGGGSLGRWLRHLQQTGEVREALDRAIVGEEGEEEEMLMAVRIAIVCLSDLPADRPSSDELAAMLTQLHSF